MPRGKGHPKTGGRKAGTPNKNSLKLEEILTKHNFNVIEEMLLLYQKTECEDGTAAIAAKLLCELAQYVYPKRKSIEHSGEINNPYLNKSLEELEALVKERLKK